VAEETLSGVLEVEHRDIDGGIEEYLSGIDTGTADTGALLRAIGALRRHIYLEEAFLFPPLKAAGMTMPIFVMEREHGELWDAMDALDAMIASESDASTMRNACRELLATLDGHNSKEEPVIYPQADARLEADATAKLHEFLENGIMPDGWRCAKAAPPAE